MKADPYPLLRNLLGAWFHQDCCMRGETLQDIVAAYARVTRRQDQHALQAEIGEFLQHAAGDIDARLAREFEPDIEPGELAADGAAFLRSISKLLDAA